MNSYPIDEKFESFGFNYEVSQTESPDGILGFMLTFIAIAVVPPLVEEFACRGLILGSLQKFGNGFAIVCSAILFGLMHGNFRQIPFAFLIGIGLAMDAFAVSVCKGLCMKTINYRHSVIIALFFGGFLLYIHQYDQILP